MGWETFERNLLEKVLLLRLSITSALLVPKPGIRISVFAVNIRYKSADDPDLVRGTAHFIDGEQTSFRLYPLTIVIIDYCTL